MTGHVIDFETGEDRVWAWCSCGWGAYAMGTGRWAERDVASDVSYHLEVAARADDPDDLYAACLEALS